ncbi:hypothetical protein O0I10_012770 [Lichtheimia ornata]|uniref:Uncharacterized protein n=1 Tax=Lichtheimia ornata TaxID=688661 RepID=A0AAD7XVH8_9FUNG|nr:uncharacterized protein O0I10_012770 [Lichtheimia ornata]KAJ8651667.1 hypothetical protein O0I10_012770 [Lichtheimia ornata]
MDLHANKLFSDLSPQIIYPPLQALQSSIIPQGISAHANYAIYAPIQAPARHGNRMAMATDRLLGSLRFGTAT